MVDALARWRQFRATLVMQDIKMMNLAFELGTYPQRMRWLVLRYPDPLELPDDPTSQKILTAVDTLIRQSHVLAGTDVPPAEMHESIGQDSCA